MAWDRKGPEAEQSIKLEAQANDMDLRRTSDTFLEKSYKFD
jgi:hypothetical protein